MVLASNLIQRIFKKTSYAKSGPQKNTSERSRVVVYICNATKKRCICFALLFIKAIYRGYITPFVTHL